MHGIVAQTVVIKKIPAQEHADNPDPAVEQDSQGGEQLQQFRLENP